MAKLTIAQKREIARKQVMEQMQFPQTMENAGQNAFAIPTQVGDEEIWVLYTVTVPQWYDTEKTKAFNPFEKEQDWQITLADREKKAKEVQAKKEKKIAKSQKKKAE